MTWQVACTILRCTGRTAAAIRLKWSLNLMGISLYTEVTTPVAKELIAPDIYVQALVGPKEGLPLLINVEWLADIVRWRLSHDL